MWIKKVFILFLGLILSQWATAQVTTSLSEPDTTKSEPIIVDIADAAEYINENGEVIKILMRDIRQVELRQGNTFMYCDTARILDKVVIAYGNIIIQQGDSVNIFADSLIYQGDSEIADLFGNVILEKEEQKLFTDRLNYSLRTKIATYNEGALLTNGGAQLTSKKGSYYLDQDLAYFSEDVIIVDSSFTLQSDTLEFDTKTEFATFHGPTLIQQDSSKIYCEAGFYDIPNKIAEFRENAQYQKGDQLATADIINYDGKIDEVLLRGNAKFDELEKSARAKVIRYDQKNDIIFLEGDAYYKDVTQEITSDLIEYNSESETFKTQGRALILDGSQILQADTVDYDADSGMAIAKGDVVWRDTVENTIIYAEHTKYNKETDFLLASGNRPMLVSISDGDTLHLAADTLQSFKINEEDSTRNFLGYPDVRIFKTDLQGLCDTVFFNGVDSIFNLKGNPILWSDSSQFLADTINIFLDSNKIDKIRFIQNALIVNTKDEFFYNQIKGREMTAHFKDNSIERMLVNGNAESVYYAMDDSTGYFGVNKSISSKMTLYFEDSDLNSIHAYRDPESSVFPMRGTDHEALKLPGFRWDWERRPKSVEDLRKEKNEVVSINQNINSRPSPKDKPKDKKKEPADHDH